MSELPMVRRIQAIFCWIRRAHLAILGILLFTACSTAPTEVGVLEGRLTNGPLAPVVGEGQAEPTPAPEVFQAWPVIVYKLDGDSEIARASAGPNGNYTIQLPAGRYLVDTARPGVGGGVNLPQEVEIIRAQVTRLDIEIDTGIRAPLAAIFSLTSPAFEEGGSIPEQYTYSLPGQCSGKNLSPPLVWSGAHEPTRSFAITVIDPDGGNWVHWVQFNIPEDVTGLNEAAGGPAVGISGQNDFGALGYGGPCPPSGNHRYVFTLYALDTTLELAKNTTLEAVQEVMVGHILAQASLTGMRKR